jgi:TonB family protein
MIDPFFQSSKNSGFGKFFIGSIFFHLFVMTTLLFIDGWVLEKKVVGELKKYLEVQSISMNEYQKLLSNARVVETEQATVDEIDLSPPKKTQHLSERTQRVKKETRSDKFGSVSGGSKKINIESLATPERKHTGGFGDFKVEILGDKVQDTGKSLLNKGSFDLMDSSISVADRTVLNTDEYVYSTFSNRMREAIAVRWEPKWRVVSKDIKRQMLPGVYITRTRIFLEPTGDVTKATVERSSGFYQLDQIAVASIYEAKYFQNPPKDLFGPSFNGSIEFSFVITITPSTLLGYNSSQQ